MAARKKRLERGGSYPFKIKKGDQVVVIAGKDRGKRGRVIRVQPSRERLFVEGVNMIKRHVRPRPLPTGGETQGGVIEQEGPIHVSNVMLVDPKDGKPTRIGIDRSSGRRVRVSKRTGEVLD
jgi:large subunit ribosomal protein L24